MIERILAVLWREWDELGRNRTVVLSVLVPPLLFAGLPLFGLWAGILPYLADNTPPLDTFRRRLSDLSTLTDAQTLEVLILGQALSLMLVAPISAALTIAGYSIVGEKQLRTLEPLLASPIRTWELLLAKILTAALPSIGASWLGFTILAVGARPVLSGPAFAYLVGPTGLLLIFVLAPLVALLGVGLAVLVSSRADDPRAAQQAGLLVVLPIFGLLVAQAVGALYLGPRVVLTASAIAAVANVLFLALAARMFRRETILTRWR